MLKHFSGVGAILGLTALVLFTAGLGGPASAVPQDVNPLAVEGPVAPEFPVQPLEMVDSFGGTSIDAAALRAEDESGEENDNPPRFAVAQYVNITPDSGGTWEVLDARFDLWRLRVTSPGALSLNLEFSAFRMPKGGRLTLYPADSPVSDDKRGVRTFTDKDNQAHGALWTPVVLGDDLVLELVIPRESRHDYDLILTSINRGYRFFGEDLAAEKSGSCNIDVACPEGDDWEQEIQSVGVFTIGGVWKCTGFMVNNTALDARALFMTADHCGLSTGNSASLVVYWNFESPTCGQQGGGTLDQFMTGATFLASSSTSDYALVEMSQAIDPVFEISFAGWDRSGADVDAAICIHHPNTDEMSISFEDDPTTITSYLSNAVPGNETHIRVTDWDLGTTEGGSSGSPLFDVNHRVVGQLHGGYAACGNNESDWYGRLFVSWPEISQYLDPLGSGALTLDTFAPYEATMVVTPGDPADFDGPVGGPFVPTSTEYLIRNNADIPLTFNASADVAWVDVSPGSGLVPEGGSLALSVTPNVSAGNLVQGSYQGILSILNLTDGQGDTSRDISLIAGLPELVYSFDMESDPGWGTEGDWAYGKPGGAGGQYGNPDPTVGFTGDNVYGYNLAGDYPNNLLEMHLVSESLDCTDFQEVTLKFHRWLNVEEPQYDHASLSVSNDGATFFPVWSNGDEVTDSSWTPVEYDISEIADGQEKVYLRWTMGTTDSNWQFSGWNLDDVEIWGLRDIVSGVEAPSRHQLGVSNYPNPFNPLTTVNFVLDRDGPTTVRVYDLKGRLVRELVDGEFAAGPHSVPWDGMTGTGGRAGSGVYLVRVVAGNRSVEHKMVLLK